MFFSVVFWVCACYMASFFFRELLMQTYYFPQCSNYSYLQHNASYYTTATDKYNYKQCFCSQYSSYSLLYGDQSSNKSYCWTFLMNV